jgi:nitrite reductase/ring-hydroxylating ferredoxin subunit
MSTEGEGLAQPDVVVPLAAVPEGRGLVVPVHERLRLAIFRVRGAVYAIDDTCPHQSASLGEGALVGAVVECPRHGFLVDVTSGQCPNHPLLRVRCFEARIEGDSVRVIVPRPS